MPMAFFWARRTFACHPGRLTPASPPSVKFSRPAPMALNCTLSKKEAEVIGALSKIKDRTYERA
jgi:hypothetical protein